MFIISSTRSGERLKKNTNEKKEARNEVKEEKREEKPRKMPTGVIKSMQRYRERIV